MSSATSAFQRPLERPHRCYRFRDINFLKYLFFLTKMAISRLLLVWRYSPIISEIKIFSLNRYTSAPIGLIRMEKIWRERRTLSNDPGPVAVGVIISEKKNVQEKFFLPLFSLNRYIAAPIGPIRTEKMGRAQRVLSNEPIPVFLCAIVRRKKFKKKNFFFLCSVYPLYLSTYWSDLDEENMGVEGATSPIQRLRSGCSWCYSFGEKNYRYNSAPIGPIWMKKTCA
ncbi:LOW QUALITY PROTEIN: hypothetical protein V1477_006252 [Vespula maculifrons]|uniref:Uncharacterized protein n=1 Tax=Vespula maculifrons TaxID=7453 RepID=A0ABD2CJZ1_VESMC